MVGAGDQHLPRLVHHLLPHRPPGHMARLQKRNTGVSLSVPLSTLPLPLPLPLASLLGLPCPHLHGIPL